MIAHIISSRRCFTSLLVLGVFFIIVFVVWRPPTSLQATYSSFHPMKWINDGLAAFHTIPEPYTAVIVYLVNAKRSKDLIDSLHSVQANLTTSKPWPILLMHTGDFDDPEKRASIMTQVLEVSGSQAFTDRVEFVRVNWTIPASINTDLNVLDPVFRHVWPGYHQMCRFYSYEIFELPRLKDVTYYMRLDTDSQVPRKACFDPFERMYSQNLSYGYKATGQDPGFVVRGMWTLVDDYAKRHPAVEAQLAKNHFRWPGNGNRDPELFSDESDQPIRAYGNSFEIVRLDTFRKPDVKEWLDELQSVPEHFFKYRWGDAPLRYQTVSMFLNVETEVGKLCDMPYFHQSLYETCECQNPQPPPPNRFVR